MLEVPCMNENLQNNAKHMRYTLTLFRDSACFLALRRFFLFRLFEALLDLAVNVNG